MAITFYKLQHPSLVDDQEIFCHAIFDHPWTKLCVTREEFANYTFQPSVEELK